MHACAHRLQEADKTSARILLVSQGFVKYAHEELEAARSQLKCCRKTHTVLEQEDSWIGRYVTYLFIALLGVGVFCVIARVSVCVCVCAAVLTCLHLLSS